MTRRIIAALLAATAALPGVAAAQDGPRDRGDRQQAQRSDDGDRAQRQARAERRAERQQANDNQNRAADQRQRIAARQDRNNDGVRDMRRDRDNDGRPDYRRPQQQVPAFRDRNGDGRLDRYDQRGQVVNRDYRGYNAYRGRPNYVANDYRRSWNNNWRNDRRYDWNRYRNYNRGAFHLPRYYAPYGWNYGYRRFSIGIRLAAPLFGENYWIDDPYDYRLPPAYGPYRWVRYYGDAILVDVRSGYVVDVIHDIFW